MDFHRAHKDEVYVGFNNRNYDDYILRALLGGFSAWDMNYHIIQKDKKGWQFNSEINRIKVNSYDCMIGYHGLKTLEGFMGSSIVETEIPFDYDGEFTQEMVDKVLYYNKQDVLETINVFTHRLNEFNSYIDLLKLFNLPLSDLSKTKARLSASILGAKKTHHDDEFQVSIPPTLKLTKYRQAVDFFMSPTWGYKSELTLTLAGVEHKYGIGGLHGAVKNYFASGEFLHIDVNSYYPSLMIVYPEFCMSRTGVKLEKYIEIRDMRLKFKAAHDSRAGALKIVLNATYGAMKDRFNVLYDPRSANNVSIFGQLLLTDLIEHLEGHCDLIQSNTDGLIVKLHGNEEEVREICHEWESRTGMGLSYDQITKIMQKDVNNYVVLFADGKIESKGAYVKQLDTLDYDLPVVNKAITANLLYGTPVEETVRKCRDLIDYQRIVKLSRNYEWVEYSSFGRRVKSENKCYRVFASKNKLDGRICACKTGKNPAKFANTPDNCVVINGNIVGKRVSDYYSILDKQWYIDLAKKRINQFLGIEK